MSGRREDRQAAIRRTAAADREREQVVAAALGREWNCTMLATPPFCRYDFTAYRDGERVGIVELRSQLSRTTADYGGCVFADDGKVRALRRIAARLAVSAAVYAWHFPLVVHWLDVTGDLPLSAVLVRTGRTDRVPPEVRDTWRIPLSDTAAVALPTFTQAAIARRIAGLGDQGG